MNKDKQEISHEGHRERLSNLIANSKIENVSDIQAVEYFLTYIFPRGDVNPLSHRLLDKFGNFANIIDANVADMLDVYGINERSAIKIANFHQLIFYYTYCKITKKLNLKNSKQFYDRLEELLRFDNTENLFLFAIDNAFNLLQTRRYDLQMVRSVGLNPYEIFRFIDSTKASYIIVAHNHPNGTAHPSDDDLEATKYIRTLIEPMGCQLLNSYIVGADGIYSETQEGFARKFQSTDEFIII